MKKRIINSVYQAIDKINEISNDSVLIVKDINTSLYGDNSELDSLGLVNLIVVIEQIIEDDFDVILTLADERAMSQKNSPFRTIDSLVNYIEFLLNEKEKINDW